MNGNTSSKNSTILMKPEDTISKRRVVYFLLLSIIPIIADVGNLPTTVNGKLE
jgi:hypothetical protein